MTDLATLCRTFERAKATNTDITLSPQDLSLMLQFASLIGEPGRPLPAPEPVPAPAVALAPSPTDDLISIDEIATKLRVGSTTLWRLRKSDPTFPTPVRTSARRKQFIRAEFNQWLLSRRD